MTGAPALPELHHHLPAPAAEATVTTSDVVVYGATSGGVIAAVRAAREGRSVTLLAFDDHVGGMTAGGLGETDVGNAAAVGGLARAFYSEVAAHYGAPDPHWTVESHVAELIYRRWLADAGVRVRYRQHLSGVTLRGRTLTELRTDDGARHRAQVFVDAGYEGDLMAAAGVPYTVGREASSVHGEPLAGVQRSENHQFTRDIDPYVERGRPASGLLPGVSADPHGLAGEGDHRIQAYNFRLQVTTAPGRLPYPEPDGYDPARYELLRRYVEAGGYELYGRTTPIHGDVYDMNNHGAFSSDHIGANYAWPDAVRIDPHAPEADQAAAAAAGHALRERIFTDHVRYQAGLLHFLANDRRLPEPIRSATRRFGLAPGEFTGTAHWPHQLYVREARRMVGDHVITQHDASGRPGPRDAVALASYVMDSHNAKRVVVDGRPVNEGNVQQPLARPFGIPYRAIVPPSGSCPNLLVAAAISASHVAFSSVRMEPVFMMLGEAAGAAAVLAAESAGDVRDVDCETLRKALSHTGAVLSWPPLDSGPQRAAAPRGGTA
jgi:hypothetical protein